MEIVQLIDNSTTYRLFDDLYSSEVKGRDALFDLYLWACMKLDQDGTEYNWFCQASLSDIQGVLSTYGFNLEVVE